MTSRTLRSRLDFWTVVTGVILVVLAGRVEAAPGGIAVPARLREVSFVGREMEVFGTTEAGEELKAVARPDPAIVDLAPGSAVTFRAETAGILFFDAGASGRRIA